MAYLIAIALAVLLFAGFLLLTRFERARGLRFFESLRNRVDEKTDKAVFVATHVDWSAFLSHFFRTLVARIAHDLAHASLIVVRVLERLLTRIVKYLRSARPQTPSIPEKPRFDMRASLSQFRLRRKRGTKTVEESV